MPELSILEILKYALKSLMDSKVFILILLEIAIFAVSVIFYKLMDKKVVKYTAVGSSLVILMFYIVNYISTVKVFLNNVTTKLVELIYFPTTLEFVLVMILSFTIMIVTLKSKNTNKILKFINSVFPIAISFIFLSIIEYINTNNIAFDEFSVFSNPIMMSLYELSMGLFVLWIIGLIIYKIDVFIINRIVIVDESELPDRNVEIYLPKRKEVEEEIKKIMMVIPNIIDPSVPIGKDDSENVEAERFGEPVVPDFEIPYHTDIMESFDGIDLDAAREVAGNGFYYLMGDIARLHSAILSYARDFMIDRGFTYCVPPFMIHGNVVNGVMSFAEMESMMYKIEGEDLYLIGTSEHSMIGKFIDSIIPEEKLPLTLTSYSPCFRKEKGAHGIEERGVYRIHQFEKQEMVVVCKPEDSMMWYDKLWKNTVDLFRSMDIPVRTLECCSGDLADLKVKSVDVEAWSPRQKKYFEVGSCSNLGDAQARRLKIRVNGEDGKKYLAHTLNNTVVAPPRMLIAFLENNLNADGTVSIPEVLRMYMGGKEKLVPKH